jgi:hypothetical protein
MPDMWKRIHNLAVRNQKPFRDAFNRVMEAARDAMPLEVMIQYLEMDRPNLAIGLFNTSLVEAAYGRELMPLVEQLMRKAAKLALPSVTEFGKQEDTELVIQALLDLNNPEAIRAASILGATEVTAITAATQRALREIIRNAQASGVSVPNQARAIALELKKGIGLTAPQVKSLNKLTAEWEAAGLSAGDIAGLQDRTRARMIRQRSLVIAQNETMEAANAGVNSLWDTAINEGLLPIQVIREWVTQPSLNEMNPCRICRPMDKQRRPMGEPFVSPYDGSTSLRPPHHIRCHCVLVLYQPPV